MMIFIIFDVQHYFFMIHVKYLIIKNHEINNERSCLNMMHRVHLNDFSLFLII